MAAARLHLRNADADRDADAATALMNAVQQGFRGTDALSVEELRSRLARPELEAGDAVVVERDGAMAGVAETFGTAPYTAIQAFTAVDPSDPEPDAVRDVLASAAERAGARYAARAEAESRPVLRFWVYGADADGAAHLARRGYRLARHTLQMVRDLDPRERAPQQPPGCRAVDVDATHDLAEIHAVVDEAFIDHDGDARMGFDEFRHLVETSPRYDPGTWQAVADDRGLVGVSINEPSTAELPDAGLIGVLAVRRASRRRGIGRYLLEASFACFAARGLRRAVLFCDAENLTGAVRLYTDAGMRVRHRDDIWERPL